MKMHALFNLKVFIFAAIIAATVSAQSSKSNRNPDRIVFLTVSLVYDSVNQEHRMTLLSQDVVQGKLKSSVAMGHGRKDGRDGELVYQILDQNSNVIEQRYLPWPLEKSLEFVDEDNNLRRIQVHPESSEIFLRLQLTPETRRVDFDRRGRRLRGDAQPLLSIDLGE